MHVNITFLRKVQPTEIEIKNSNKIKKKIINKKKTKIVILFVILGKIKLICYFKFLIILYFCFYKEQFFECE